jgi:hypothetical protein
MEKSEVTSFLNWIELGDTGKKGSLRHLIYVIGETSYRYAKKDQVIAKLCEYYCAPHRFEQIWSSLSAAERKIISYNIWSSGDEPCNYADDIAKEYGIAKNNERPYYYYQYSQNGLTRFLHEYADDKSLLWLLSPNNYYDSMFYDELHNAVGEMERAYSVVTDKLVFYSRQTRTTDFMSIVRFCNSNKLTVTKSGILSKSSALKLLKFCGYEEFTSSINAQPQDMRTTQGLLVTLPLSVLCTIGGLLAIAEGGCIPGGRAVSLLGQSHEQLVKHLFDSYLKSKSFDEISIMTGIKPKRGHRPFEARQNLAKELKYCKAGQAVDTQEFVKYLRLVDKTFARRDEKYVVEIGSSNYDYAASWEEYELPLIYIILSFFGALGIIDIAWGEDAGEIAYERQRLPLAFKINPLGAYVLGLAKSYTAPTAPTAKSQGGFIVLPDYTIVVAEGPDRLRHEMYFEKLFTKVSATEQTVIYKLDF